MNPNLSKIIIPPIIIYKTTNHTIEPEPQYDCAPSGHYQGCKGNVSDKTLGHLSDFKIHLKGLDNHGFIYIARLSFIWL